MSYPVYYPIAGDTLPHFFDTFDGGTGASITMTGLAVGDILIYKDGGVTQRSSTSGFTLLDTDGIDFDTITGIHGFSIDLSDNTDAGFYSVGPWYHVVISTITVDAQTVSFVACAFRILDATRGMAGTALPDAAADAAGGLPISDAGGLDLDAILVDTNSLNDTKIPDVLSLANINTQADTALTDYDPPTYDELLAFVQLILRSDAAIATDRSAVLTAINANQGSGAGDYDNATDSEEALRDWVGDGTNLTEAGGTGDHLTAIDLPDQTMNIAGNITGNLSGSVGSVTGSVGSVTGNVGGNVTGSVGSVLGGINTTAGVITTLDALDTAQDSQHSTTQTNQATILSKLLKYFQLALRSDAAIATDNATELTAINADGGSGLGDFANTTEALEAIRDRGDAAWITGSAADVWAVAVRTITGGTIDTNNDKTGYSLSVAGIQAIWDALTAALTTVGSIGKLLVDNVNATVGSRATQADILSDATPFAGANIDATISSRATPAQVNTEVVDALATDTYAEPSQGNPAATISLSAKINYLYKAWRNKKDNDGATTQLYADDGVTVDQKQTTSEAAGTVTKAEWVTGP